MGAANLAHELAPRGIHVVVLHPGFVRTDMTGGGGNVDPPEAASGLIVRIDESPTDTRVTAPPLKICDERWCRTERCSTIYSTSANQRGDEHEPGENPDD